MKEKNEILRECYTLLKSLKENLTDVYKVPRTGVALKIT